MTFLNFSYVIYMLYWRKRMLQEKQSAGEMNIQTIIQRNSGYSLYTWLPMAVFCLPFRITWNVTAIALKTKYLPQSDSLKEPRLSFYQERKLEAQSQKLHWAVEKTQERSPKCKTKWIWEELLPPKRSSSLVALGLPRMLQLPLLTMKLLLRDIHKTKFLCLVKQTNKQTLWTNQAMAHVIGLLKFIW